MEKQILELLKEMNDRQKEMNDRLVSVESGQKEMNDRLVSVESGQKEMNDRLVSVESGLKKIDKKVDAIAEQTVDLVEFKTTVVSDLEEIKRDMYKVEVATANNWSDIAKLKAIR